MKWVILLVAALLATLLIARPSWMLGGAAGATYPGLGPQPPTRSQAVGKWLFCATQWVNPHNTRAQLTQADTVIIQAYACTKVVISADGRGYAELEQGKPYAFTWQQQGARLAITYLGAPAGPRLPGGVYKVRLVAGSPHSTTSPITQLQLSTTQGETHILEALP